MAEYKGSPRLKSDKDKKEGGVDLVCAKKACKAHNRGWGTIPEGKEKRKAIAEFEAGLKKANEKWAAAELQREAELKLGKNKLKKKGFLKID